MISMIERITDNVDFSLSEDVVQLDGFDDCICGVVERFRMDTVLLYDTNRIIDKMINEDGMTHFEALEYFDFNILGAWLGDGTPCFTSYLIKDD